MADLGALRSIITELDSINVPVGLTQQIAIPLAKASGELKELYNAIVDALKKQQETQQGTNDDQKEAAGGE